MKSLKLQCFVIAGGVSTRNDNSSVKQISHAIGKQVKHSLKPRQ